MKIGFLFLGYCGLLHNWNIHNAFVFYGRHRARTYSRNLTGILMFQIYLFEVAEILGRVFILLIGDSPCPIIHVKCHKSIVAPLLCFEFACFPKVENLSHEE